MEFSSYALGESIRRRANTHTHKHTDTRSTSREGLGGCLLVKKKRALASKWGLKASQRSSDGGGIGSPLRPQFTSQTTPRTKEPSSPSLLLPAYGGPMQVEWRKKGLPPFIFHSPTPILIPSRVKKRLSVPWGCALSRERVKGEQKVAKRK
jgi:hypothetical protein